jgi:hypothetical protein
MKKLVYAPDQQALRAADSCNKALMKYTAFTRLLIVTMVTFLAIIFPSRSHADCGLKIPHEGIRNYPHNKSNFNIEECNMQNAAHVLIAWGDRISYDGIVSYATNESGVEAQCVFKTVRQMTREEMATLNEDLTHGDRGTTVQDPKILEMLRSEEWKSRIRQYIEFSCSDATS